MFSKLNNRSLNNNGAPLGNDGSTRALELEAWLKKNSETPGARFVHLLRSTLHYAPGAEASRINSCKYDNPNKALCFGGGRNYEKTENETRNYEVAENLTRVPMKEDSLSVWQLRRFHDNNHLIHRLDTDAVCLPLLLAGASVQGVAVELGTFVGLSSRCIGMGLSSTDMTNAFYAFDTFTNVANYNSITSAMPWVKEYNPDYGPSSSFKWLWEMTMEDAYPTANAFEGFINADTVNPAVWGDRPISLLSVDSVKTLEHWRAQFAGLQPNFLERGAIFCLMDFTFTAQPLFVYACLRDYLQPVYTSWCVGEHWIFIVTETIPSNRLYTCLKELPREGPFSPSEAILDKVVSELNQDLSFLGDDALNDDIECVSSFLMKKLAPNSTGLWNTI